MQLLTTALIGVLALTSTAFGAPTATFPDYFVDAVSGDDANGGTSPGDAWRTLTHAANTVPDLLPLGGTVRVAPGLYDQALGEVFPIRVRPLLSFVSDMGPAATIVDGGGTPETLFELEQPFQGGSVLFEGLTLRDAGRGVLVYPVGGACTADFVDLEVTGMAEAGLYALADGSLTIRLERVRSTGNAYGFITGSFFTPLQATATDCEFSGNSEIGASVSGGDADLVFDLESCRVERNGNVGVSASGQGLSGGCTMRLTGCLVADNAGGGSVSGSVHGATGRIEAVRTTFARNGDFGLRVGPLGGVDLDSCILAGHMQDLELLLPAAAAARYTMIHDRAFEGVDGNIGGFPLFVDAAAGDYGLRPDSPCVDAGNPALGLDPDCTRADMGAFAFDQGGPQTYCSGKPNSLGCVPFVATTGTPSASGTASFFVEAHDVLPDQAGVLLYGFAPGHLAFHGGTLCIKAPLRRLSTTSAKQTGTPPCPGTLRRDFNQVVQGGADVLLTAGQVVHAQWLQRDPADPAGFGDSLSNGVTFSVCP